MHQGRPNNHCNIKPMGAQAKILSQSILAERGLTRCITLAGRTVAYHFSGRFWTGANVVSDSLSVNNSRNLVWGITVGSQIINQYNNLWYLYIR